MRIRGLPAAVFCSHFSRQTLSNHETDVSLRQMLRSGLTGDTVKVPRRRRVTPK